MAKAHGAYDKLNYLVLGLPVVTHDLWHVSMETNAMQFRDDRLVNFSISTMTTLCGKCFTSKKMETFS